MKRKMSGVGAAGFRTDVDDEDEVIGTPPSVILGRKPMRKRKRGKGRGRKAALADQRAREGDGRRPGGGL